MERTQAALKGAPLIPPPLHTGRDATNIPPPLTGGGKGEGERIPAALFGHFLTRLT